MKKVFVVGNSRSGTTLMARILGLNDAVYTMHELHFFEQLWDPTSHNKLTLPQAQELFARLLTMHKDGYYHQKDIETYLDEAFQVIQHLSFPICPSEILSAMLQYETERNGKQIACVQTPRNVYYLREILDFFPEAYIVNMIRDPRDVLLSQKKKWQRRLLGAKNIPFSQLIRFWANYHPITMSILWNSGIDAANHMQGHPRIIQVKFEDMLIQPETTIRQICNFLNVDFTVKMLQVPQIGSSHRQDQHRNSGINLSAAGNWQTNGIDQTDIVFCEKITKARLVDQGYKLSNFRPNPLIALWLGISWPLKILLAFFFNLGRTRNLAASFKRRMPQFFA